MRIERVGGLVVLILAMFGGTACAQQQTDPDPWDQKGTSVTPKTASSVYVPAPASQGTASGSYQMTPQQREQLKQSMAQTAQQVGQVTKDFKEFYNELQKAVKDSGIVEEVNKMNLNSGMTSTRSGSRGGFGATDIQVGDADMTVIADLPGVDKKDLSVTLAEASAIRIRVDRSADDDPSEYRLSERYRGNFDKTVQLPYKAIGKKFSAQLKDGVLTVVIPREKTAATDEVPIPIS